MANQSAAAMERACGYDVPFLSDVDPRFMCPICLLVLKDPMQTACGHRFCDGCIRRVYLTNNVLTCPVDKQYSRVNQMFHDVAIYREILSLHVQCPKMDDGCLWRGELRDLEKHRDMCRKEEVKCSACDVTVLRCELEEHLAVCPSRQVTCRHCQEQVIYQDLETHTASCPRAVITCDKCGEVELPREEMEQHIHPDSGSCSKVLVVCPFHVFGCSFQAERLLMSKHIDSEAVQKQHLDLAKEIVLKNESTITELKEIVHSLKKQVDEISPIVRQNERKNTAIVRDLMERNVTGRVHWKVKLNIRRRGQYTSPIVYTGCPGYKVQMLLDLDGHRENNLRYSTLHLTLLPGEYDEEVVFPFNATCLVTLYDQGNAAARRNNFSTTMVVREVPRVMRHTHAHERIYRRGLNTFFKKSELTGTGSRFLRQSCLHMEITILHCFYPPPEMAHLPYGGPVLTHSPVMPPNTVVSRPNTPGAHPNTPIASPTVSNLSIGS